jgi:hypothetical protein
VRPVTPALPHVEPDAGYRWNLKRDLPDNDPQTLLILTFSGGGTRAAAISYGVLEESRRTTVRTASGVHTMLTEVDLMTAPPAAASRRSRTRSTASVCSRSMTRRSSSAMSRAPC